MTKPKRMRRVLTVFLVCAATAIASQAQTFNTLVNFDLNNGGLPQYVSLIQGADGELYGTTSAGGQNSQGTIFKVSRGGAPATLTTLYSFCSQANCADGYDPWPGLVLATDGNFYGTTELGGDVTCNPPLGCGTVFEITPSGTLTTLHSFTGPDGSFPGAGLIQGSYGAFFGTTEAGGNLGCRSANGAYGCGTTYKITSEGAFVTLHRFNRTDGDDPNSPLLLATNGNFYGTTYFGGESPHCGGGCGTIFKMTPSGKVSTLYSFCSVTKCPDGEAPFGGLIQASDGSLYGTTELGGANGYGTAFTVTPSGRLTSADLTGGSEATGRPVQGTDGAFYDTTQVGGNGACNCGTVFQSTPNGVQTTLHNFTYADGAWPFGGLLQATDGIFYGTTWEGGKYDDGTIFSLNMGLAPFVAFVQSFGRIGHTGGILGQGFTGTTSVSFNGIPANFTVVSDTYLEATVPPGATTGYVTVTTPTGVLKSNVPFHVVP